MKSMNQLARSHRVPVHPVADVTSLNQQAAYDINDIFKSLRAVFPTFRLTFPDDESLRVGKKVWVKTLLEGKITSLSQIAVGMRRARASGDFMPSAGKFAEWCRPTAEDLGLPSREAAYAEAIGNLGQIITAKWSHAAVFEAVKITTCYTLKNSAERDSRALFYRNYAVMIDRLMHGEILSAVVPKAITAVPEFRAAPPEVERDYLDQLKRKVGLL